MVSLSLRLASRAWPDPGTANDRLNRRGARGMGTDAQSSFRRLASCSNRRLAKPRTAAEWWCYGREVAPEARGRRTDPSIFLLSPSREGRVRMIAGLGRFTVTARAGDEEVPANCYSRAKAEHKDGSTTASGQ